jgi:O-antigen/teichoic acid export membrane protein
MVQAAVSGPGDMRGEARERRSFVRYNVLATGSTLIAGALGFGLQSITSHALNPGSYGKAFVVITFFALLTRPAAAFGRLVAWQTSRERSEDAEGQVRSNVLREVTIKLLVVGTIVGLLCCAFASVPGHYIGVPISFVIAGAVGVPCMLALQPLLGGLQGEKRFGPWSWLNIWVTLSRVALVVALIYVLGAYGVVWGTTLSGIVTFIAAAIAVRPMLRRTNAKHPDGYRTPFRWRPVAPFIVTAIASTMTIGVFLSADVIIVEHFFNKTDGGQYSVVSAIGNSVFFITGGVIAVVFPLVAERHARNRSTFGVMGVSLGLCALLTLVGFLGLQIFGRFILENFAGARYVAGDRYLGWYALGMGLMGCVVVLLNTQQSLNRMTLLWILIPATLARPALLVFFHGTLLTVVVVSDISAVVFGSIMLAMYIVSERARQRDAPVEAGPAVPGERGIPEPAE